MQIYPWIQKPWFECVDQWKLFKNYYVNEWFISLIAEQLLKILIVFNICHKVMAYKKSIRRECCFKSQLGYCTVCLKLNNCCKTNNTMMMMMMTRNELWILLVTAVMIISIYSHKYKKYIIHLLWKSLACITNMYNYCKSVSLEGMDSRHVILPRCIMCTIWRRSNN